MRHGAAGQGTRTEEVFTENATGDASWAAMADEEEGPGSEVGCSTRAVVGAVAGVDDELAARAAQLVAASIFASVCLLWGVLD